MDPKQRVHDVQFKKVYFMLEPTGTVPLEVRITTGRRCALGPVFLPFAFRP